MSTKTCHIDTIASKCVKDRNNLDPCRFEPQYYDLSGETFTQCNYTPCPQNDACFEAMKSQGKKKMYDGWTETVDGSQVPHNSEVSECTTSLQKIGKTYPSDDALFHPCRAKCTFLIAIGEFIERYLHIPTATPLYTKYFKEKYCPSADTKGVVLENCIEQMTEFYEKFYLHLEAPCYTNCLAQCMDQGGPPEFLGPEKGKFTYDIFHHIYYLPPVAGETPELS